MFISDCTNSSYWTTLTSSTTSIWRPRNAGSRHHDLGGHLQFHPTPLLRTSSTLGDLGRRFSLKIGATEYPTQNVREREMFYLTTHSTHFIYGYMASDIWLRTILIVRKETRCRHIGYCYRLTARVLLYAPSHRQDNTYHGLCYTSRGALAGTRNSSMGPPHEGSIRRRTMSERSTSELRPAPFKTWVTILFLFIRCRLYGERGNPLPQTSWTTISNL